MPLFDKAAAEPLACSRSFGELSPLASGSNSLISKYGLADGDEFPSSPGQANLTCVKAAMPQPHHTWLARAEGRSGYGREQRGRACRPRRLRGLGGLPCLRRLWGGMALCLRQRRFGFSWPAAVGGLACRLGVCRRILL